MGYGIEYTETIRNTPDPKTGELKENIVTSDYYLERDFTDAELCKRYGTYDPLDVPTRMLTAGESAMLADAILRLNGFLNESAEGLEEEAKNS